jgi:hypothetical protein
MLRGGPADISEVDQGLVVRIRRSKTDQEGQGHEHVSGFRNWSGGQATPLGDGFQYVSGGTGTDLWFDIDADLTSINTAFLGSAFPPISYVQW